MSEDNRKTQSYNKGAGQGSWSKGKPSSTGRPAGKSGGFAGRSDKPKSTGGFTGRSGKPESTGGFAGRSSRTESTGGYAGRSGRPESTGGYAGRSGRPESTGGYAARSGKPESTGGYAGRSGRPESTGGYAARTGRPESTGGYAAGSGKPESTGYKTKTYRSTERSEAYKPTTSGTDKSKYESKSKPSYKSDQRLIQRADQYPDRDSKPTSDRSIGSEYRKDKKTDSKRDQKTNHSKDQKPNYYRDCKTESKTDKKSAYSRSQETSRERKPIEANIKKADKVSRRPAYSGNKVPRIQGSCQYIRECGNCRILQQSYAADLIEKQKMVDSLLKSYCKVEPIIGMENPNNYRNKVQVIFDHDKKGNPISGVYEEGTHRVVPIENCLIHNQKADAIIASIRGMLKGFKIKTYDVDSDYGLLRYVMVRTGFTSGEIMVVLVISSPILPSKNNFVKALLEQHPEITTIVVNVNDKKTSMGLGNKEQVIYGKGYIEDSLCNKTFRISSKSFYQVNPAQAEVIYKKAIELAQLNGSETVIDAYSGIGTIGIIVSDHVNKVIGVELNKDAVHDANNNAKRNDIKNIEFFKNDAGEFMSQMAGQNGIVDVVFMDPPRTGSNEQFMDALALLKPKKVVYISCNPINLERDLQYLTRKGFKAERVIPVDMFPWTGHVETVCLMSRKESK